MSITKLKTLGQWAAVPTDLTHVRTRGLAAQVGGRRIITGMLTGSDGPLASPAPSLIARVAGTRPGTRK